MSPYIVSVMFPREGNAVAHVYQIIDGGHNTNPVNLDNVDAITWVAQVDTEREAELLEAFVNLYLATTPGLSTNSDLQELQGEIRALTANEEFIRTANTGKIPWYSPGSAYARGSGEY